MVRPYWAANPRRIETEVILEKVDYMKGRLPDSGATFTLTVPGGTIGDVSERVADTPTFATGEHWILFLLPQYKTFPVVGLDQGAFRVQTDADGTVRVYDAGHRPVTGLDAGGYVQVHDPRPSNARTCPTSANNLRVHAAPAPPPPGLNYDDFLSQLRPVLAASKDHRLTQPAGRRILVQFHPVPLRLSDEQGASLKTDAGASRPRAAGDAVKPAPAPQRASQPRDGRAGQ